MSGRLASAQELERFRAVAPLHTVQPPYNLFERAIEHAVLPYARRHHISTLTYGALYRGLLSSKMRPDTRFTGDDLRQTDPKFRPPRYAQYLRVVERLDRSAHEQYCKRGLNLALRWTVDQPGVSVALWGARHPEQLMPVDNVAGWKLDAGALHAIDGIIRETGTDPVGPEFMALPVRSALAAA